MNCEIKAARDTWYVGQWSSAASSFFWHTHAAALGGLQTDSSDLQISHFEWPAAVLVAALMCPWTPLALCHATTLLSLLRLRVCAEVIIHSLYK